MSNPTPNIPRLRNLADSVETAKDNEWDMRMWAHKTECGTVGCAFWHYVMKNPDCGFRIKFYGNAGEIEYGDGNTVFDSGRAAHFGIDDETQYQLFVPDEDQDTSRLAVLARIREVITRAEKEVGK